MTMSLLDLVETFGSLLVCMVLPSALALYFSAPRNSEPKNIHFHHR